MRGCISAQVYAVLMRLAAQELAPPRHRRRNRITRPAKRRHNLEPLAIIHYSFIFSPFRRLRRRQRAARKPDIGQVGRRKNGGPPKSGGPLIRALAADSVR